MNHQIAPTNRRSAALRAAILLLGVACVMPRTVTALPLLDHPYVDNGDNGPFSELEGQQVADDFTLPASTTVGRLRWFGTGLSVDPYTDGQAVQFRIRLYDDNGSGAPQMAPFSDVTVSATAHVTGTITGGNDHRTLYEFTATDTVLVGGALQWLSILESDVATPTSIFRWANSPSVDGDQSCHHAANSSNWNCSTTERPNLAFTLLGPLPPNCGDGSLQMDEQCDDGANNGTAGDCCQSDCSFNDGASCNDADVCTANDVCSSGTCAGAPLNCDDFDACTTDSCTQADGCTHAKTGHFFGDDDSGCLPPDAATAKCAEGVVKATSKLMGAITTCHVKAAGAALKGGIFLDESCESNPITGKGALDKFGTAVAKLGLKCGSNCAIANAGSLATITESFLDEHNGAVYCDGSLPLNLFDEDEGFVPPDKATGKCEAGVAKMAAKLEGALLTCHRKTAHDSLKGGPVDDTGCETTAKGKYDAAVAKLATKCSGCAVANAPGLRDAVEEFVDDNNKMTYCAP